MDPDFLRVLVAGVLAAFGGGGLWSWLSTRHKPKIDRETAVVANANDVTERALAIAERADTRSLQQETRIAVLEDRLTVWVNWGHRIVTNWSVYRLEPDPPTLPGGFKL